MKAQTRKKFILDVAKTVFARNGYNKTNIAMICEKAGIGRGTLYIYFKNKEDVFRAIIDDIVEEVSEALIIDISAEQSVEEIINSNAERLERVFKLLYKNRPFAGVVFGASSEFPKVRQGIDQHFIAIILKELEMCRDVGLLKPGIDYELSAVRMWGGFEKFVMYYLLDRSKVSSQGQIKDLVDQMFLLEYAGLSVYTKNSPQDLNLA